MNYSIPYHYLTIDLIFYIVSDLCYCEFIGIIEPNEVIHSFSCIQGGHLKS